MKRIDIAFISVGFSILFSLSILLAIGGKNSNNLFPSAQSVPSSLRADGDPPPPFPKLPKRLSLIRTSESMVIADGDPPPPFPKLPKRPSLIRTSESIVIADGDPPPPFPKLPKKFPIGFDSGFGLLSSLPAAEGKLA
jgi:hypothetical protein